MDPRCGRLIQEEVLEPVMGAGGIVQPVFFLAQTVIFTLILSGTIIMPILRKKTFVF